MYRRIFTRGVSVTVAAVTMLIMAAGTVSAGTCAVFCSSVVGNTITREPGTHPCNSASDCQGVPQCPGLRSAAVDGEVRAYCRSTEGGDQSDRVARSTWCLDYLGLPNPSRAERFDGLCSLPPQVVTGTGADNASAPPPARPGDQFRCRFMCSGDTAPRNGSTCSGTSDQSTCVRECQTVCGSDSCGGTMNGGTLRNDTNSQQQQPQCVPTENAVNRTQNFAGITDTLQFETINESFRNISLPLFLGNVIRVMIGFAGAIFLLMLLWAGLRWTTAGENKTAVEGAQKTIRNAVIGIVAVAASYVLVTAVIELFGTVTSGITSTS